jgi:hypothetical protein
LLDALGVVVARQAQQFEQLHRPRAAVGGVDAADLERELDVLADRAVRKERERLEHHAGRALLAGNLG